PGHHYQLVFGTQLCPLSCYSAFYDFAQSASRSQPGRTYSEGSLPRSANGTNPSRCRSSSARNCGFNNRYLFQRRSGSLENRNNHSSPRSCIQRGACWIVPARNGNAAPTARSGQERNSRNSYTHISCCGQPKPTKMIEAPDFRISSIIWSLSGSVR